MLDRKQIDFLYWHAVSKMRMGEFKDAGILFRMLRAACPQRHDVGLGHAYSLMRQGALEEAHAVVAELRRHPMRSEEMALLGRLHRRCDFERQQRARRGLERAPARPMSGVVA